MIYYVPELFKMQEYLTLPYYAKAEKIKCFITDVDGVLTDGAIIIDNHGNELRSFNVQDGMGLKLLMLSGIEVAVITTSKCEVIDHRMRQLGITHYFKGQYNKENAFLKLQEILQIDFESFAYIGDDLPDIPIMQQVGLSFAVANAVPEVKASATIKTTAKGGSGAVREACDFLLTAQNKTATAIKKYLSLS